MRCVYGLCSLFSTLCSFCTCYSHPGMFSQVFPIFINILIPFPRIYQFTTMVEISGEKTICYIWSLRLVNITYVTDKAVTYNTIFFCIFCTTINYAF